MSKSIKILAIGNSFADNAMAYLYPILAALGYDDIVLGNLFIGGCSLATHTDNALNNLPAYTYRKNTTGKFVNVDNVSISTALADEDWQYVTMQQASGASGLIYTYDVEALKNYVYGILDKSRCELLWHMTWAYQQDSTHPEFHNYNNCQLEMYQSIVRCVQQKITVDSDFIDVIPSGTAIQNARTSYLGDTLTADGFHLDELGEFIAGLTWAATITRCDLNKLDISMLPQQFIRYLNIATESVINALADPFEITESTCTTNPDAKANIFEVTTAPDISYSNCSETCKLDAYMPSRRGFDTIIHFHGGGFTAGDKSDCAPIAFEVASRGIAFISVNYRLYPEAKYGDFYVDAANAIRYVVDTLASVRGEGKIYLSGQSAGANILMTLAFNKRYLEDVSLKPTDVAGWVIESGQPTVHFEVLRQSQQDGDLQIIDERAPLYYVNGETNFNKMLLIAYTDDIVNRLNQNRLLYDTLRKNCANMPVELRVLYGQHCVSSTTPYRGKFAYTDVLLDFVRGKKK